MSYVRSVYVLYPEGNSLPGFGAQKTGATYKQHYSCIFLGKTMVKCEFKCLFFLMSMPV